MGKDGNKKEKHLDLNPEGFRSVVLPRNELVEAGGVEPPSASDRCLGYYVFSHYF